MSSFLLSHHLFLVSRMLSYIYIDGCATRAGWYVPGKRGAELAKRLGWPSETRGDAK